MLPHEERVVAEKTELDEKLKRLHEFIQNKSVFQVLDDSEKVRLIRQENAMTDYSRVLDERISAFPPATQE